MPDLDETLNADWLGGPPEVFDRLGREQLAVLLEHGLTFDSTVLDIGCGCLRGGRWIIPLLNRGHYCGIEPMAQMVAKGLERFADPETVALKQPRFDHNDRFDMSVFETKFTHFLARSIWTHASKPQIEKMLDGAAEFGTPDFVFLASYLPALFLGSPDYKGGEWVGRSHVSEKSGTVAHSLRWIRRACRKRGLVVGKVDRPPINGQHWLRITR